MKLAIMQPYFFPYLGYYSLLDYADKFIILDIVQYKRKSWMNRNRILHPNDGWQYIKAGLTKAELHATINSVLLSSDKGWIIRILNQLEHYKKRAPYYIQTINVVKTVLYDSKRTLLDLNFNSLKIVADYIGIACDIKIYSHDCEDVSSKVNGPGGWALEISTSEKASLYINPPGGKDLFDRKSFLYRGIDIRFLENRLTKYKQNRDGFEPGLSVIDVMMFNSPNDIKALVKDYFIE